MERSVRFTCTGEHDVRSKRTRHRSGTPHGNHYEVDVRVLVNPDKDTYPTIVDEFQHLASSCALFWVG